MKFSSRLITLLPLPLLLAGCSHTPAPAAFNVPALVGLKIAGVTANLGTPSEYTDPNSIQHPPGITQWDATWKKGGVELLVTYDLQSGRIIDFFIGTDDPSGATSDSQRLQELGNLKDGDSHYHLDLVPALGHPGQYTGIKAIPN